MPTIVHTMLVRVGSTVCCGRVGSAGDGAATSGSGGTEASGEGCSGASAWGLSTLVAVPPVLISTIGIESSRDIVAGCSWPLHDGRARPRRQEDPQPAGPRQRLAPHNPKRLVPRYLVILPPADTRPGGGR